MKSAPGAVSFATLQAPIAAAGYGVIAPAQDTAAEPQDVEADARR